MPENFSTHTRNGDFLTEMKLGSYLEIVYRRRWWVILSSIGLFIAAMVLAYRLPNTYRAETVILVNSAEVPDKYVPTIVTADIAARLTTLQQQVLSPTRLKKLVEAEGLYPEPTGKRTEEEVIRSVQKSIVVETVNPGAGKMGAFRIAYSGRKQSDVARIANDLAQLFIDTNLQAREDQTQGTAEFLLSQLQETKHQLDEKDLQLRAIKSQNILDLPESKPYHMEALANLRAQAQNIQDKINQDQREKSMLESLLISGGGTAPTVDVDSGGDGAPTSPYQAQVQKLEARLAELRTRYGPSHPDVRKVQDELTRLKNKAESDPQSTAAPAVQQNPAIQSGGPRRNPVLEAQIEKLNEEIRDQGKLLQPLQQRMEFHTSKLQQVPEFEQRIARLQQDYDILRTQYTGLLEKEKAAEISHALEVRQKGERFEVLDSAITPDKPYAPNRILISVAGLIAGIGLGLGLVAAAEMNDEAVQTESEAAEILGTPVLAGVPWIISGKESAKRRLRAVGMVAGTVVGAVAFGLFLSFVAGGLF